MASRWMRRRSSLAPKTGKFKAEGGGITARGRRIRHRRFRPQEHHVAKDSSASWKGNGTSPPSVPRNAKEATRKDHVSETVKVQVQKRALRVLLFTSGATREYQFVRTILYREMLEKRMESLHLQSAKRPRKISSTKDVEAERLLAGLPDQDRAEPVPEIHEPERLRRGRLLRSGLDEADGDAAKQC